MKMLILACNISMVDKVTDILLKEKIDSWQAIENVKGKLPSMLPHMDSAVWPGYNALFLIQAMETETKKVLEACYSLNSESLNQDEMIYGWSLEVNSFLNN